MYHPVKMKSRLQAISSNKNNYSHHDKLILRQCYLMWKKMKWYVRNVRVQESQSGETAPHVKTNHQNENTWAAHCTMTMKLTWN